ncbi:MAG TPA: sigma-70 family RNA polymerase sigma factor [Candidatus Eisenbacteria bacterium]|nr:sigma-70 family RNA polymerase sigma factor [Candidatus Eisenbacteria bacterium]
MKPRRALDPSKEQMVEAPPGRGAGRPLLQDEPELLSRCRAGETAAFATLVDRYRDRAYGLAFRLTRSVPDAEEVAQDAFVSAWKSLRDFRGDASFSTWLYRIVWRKALDRAESLRNRGRREIAVDDPARVEAEAMPGGMGSAGPAELARSESSARLERLLATLPEAARAVVTLFYYEDRSVSDVAAALGIPEGTVKTHLYRSRAALREGWLREEEAERDDDAMR